MNINSSIPLNIKGKVAPRFVSIKIANSFHKYEKNHEYISSFSTASFKLTKNDINNCMPITTKKHHLISIVWHKRKKERKHVSGNFMTRLIVYFHILT